MSAMWSFFELARSPEAYWLSLEVSTNWHVDNRWRLNGTRALTSTIVPSVVVAAAADGYTTAFARELPERLIADLNRTIDAVPPVPAAGGQGSPPSAITACQTRLAEESIEVAVVSGPSFMVPPRTVHESGVDVVGWKDVPERDRVHHCSVPDGWSAAGWGSLLSGELGPWAMAIEGELVLALCFAVSRSDDGAEAGLWSHPEHRGKGHAATVLARWGQLVHESGLIPFYRTAAEDESGRRVAERLHLPLVGWIWQLIPESSQ